MHLGPRVGLRLGLGEGPRLGLGLGLAVDLVLGPSLDLSREEERDYSAQIRGVARGFDLHPTRGLPRRSPE